MRPPMARGGELVHPGDCSVARGPSDPRVPNRLGSTVTSRHRLPQEAPMDATVQLALVIAALVFLAAGVFGGGISGGGWQIPKLTNGQRAISIGMGVALGAIATLSVVSSNGRDGEPGSKAQPGASQPRAPSAVAPGDVPRSQPTIEIAGSGSLFGAQPGDPLTVSGRNFTPGHRGRLELDGVFLKNFQADQEGRFSEQVAIPDDPAVVGAGSGMVGLNLVAREDPISGSSRERSASEVVLISRG